MSAARYTESDVRRLAGPRSCERGLGYLDAVGPLRVDSGRITASVQGTERYSVALEDGDGLRAACTCPYGEDGHFCRHCVAVALTALRQADRLPALREEAAMRDAALDTWLDGLGRDELLRLVREQLAEDADFKNKLALRVAVANADTSAVRADITALLDPADFTQYGYIAYEDAPGYAAQVTRAAQAIRDLAADGHGAVAVALAREGIRRVVGVYETADDSDGSIAEAAEDLARAHLAACFAAPPDPDETAQWLIDHCLGDGGEYLEVEPADYREVLGVQGLAALRALAAEAHGRNPSGWAEQSLLESLARTVGNLDELIAVRAASLEANGYTHLTIAEELDAAGRSDEALEWAERGLSHAGAEGQPPHRGLVDHLAAHYARDGRPADALTVRRDHFQSDRSLHTYRALRAAARAVGHWDTERPPALEQLRVDAEENRKRQWGGAVLIDALTDDADFDAAWAAVPGLATADQLLRLADASATTRPAAALAVYTRQIESCCQYTGDGNYARIADLLTKARACHEELGTPHDFTAYVARLRTEQKRKRNLMRILDHRGL
ncbi:SWIM zinc finger domain-containing protein [Streptomyces antimycoticus]|uniref:SWIM zinc finger family protein n=1 Tax=Streptomyces antimycoticus TaxID=68175 RepID=UPI0036ACF997